MNGWIIATIVLACLFIFSLITILIHGLEEKWNFLNFLSIYMIVFLLPIIWPALIWNACYERKQKKTACESADCSDCVYNGSYTCYACQQPHNK